MATELMQNVLHYIMGPSFYSVTLLMFLSLIFGLISVYIFTHFLIPDPHFMSDYFACGELTIHDLYRYNVYVTIPTVYITSIYYTFLDNYYEKRNILHLKRIYNPGYKPLYKVPWKLVQKATTITFFSVYQYILFHTFIGILFWKWRGICDTNYSFWSHSHIINAFYVAIYMILYLLIADIIFYSTHRLLHIVPYLYVHVHKLHHTWVDTFGIASSASSFWENLFVGIPTLTFTPFILKLPIGFAYVLMTIGGLSTICSHSGYDGVLGGIPHDFHHHFRECEFGTGGICDWLFSTRMEDVYPWKDLMLAIKRNLSEKGDIAKKCR